MGRSGKRARALRALLGRVGEVPARPTLPRPAWGDLVEAGVSDAVAEIYEHLGGVHTAPRIAPGPWDMQLDAIAVELDEENHFNRYRGATLGAGPYEHIAHVDRQAYRTWCGSEESACLTYGQYWTNVSCEREFGPAGPEGDLTGPGSPRWKQRAFYDFVKDLSPKALDIAVARVSIYETVTCGNEIARVGDVLYRDLGRPDATSWGLTFADLIAARADSPGRRP